MNNEELTAYNIIDILDSTVQTLVKVRWANDDCPPEFWVSLDNEDLKNQSIMISISHGRIKFTEKLFPRLNTKYGYSSLLDQMISMYNRTM